MCNGHYIQQFYPFTNWRIEIPRSLRISILTLAVCILPQELEGSLYLLWITMGSYLIYLCNKVSKETKEIDSRRSEISPQSQEVPTTGMESATVSMGSGTAIVQNVKFVDTNAGFLLDSNGREDPLRDSALLSDATLDEFFKRPIKIQSFDWNIGAGALCTYFDPWSDYFTNLRVINRLANYRLLRSKLHIKVTISGTGFHYGRAILAYNPFPNRDTLTTVRTLVEADFVGASQRPHIYLNPTCSQGGEMLLPFFYYENLIDIVESKWSDMGQMVLCEIQPLKHANGAADTVTINVFAWAEDIKFAIPTQAVPANIDPQGDEYGVGPISRVAGVVAATAGRLTTIPMIGAFARSTEIGASALGALATLFGYSRPVNLIQNNIRPNVSNSIAVTNIDDQCSKMTVDVKQELSIDPGTAGLPPTDELGINYIASKESFFTTFDWPLGTISEALLYNIAIDPRVHIFNGAEVHMPACCFASVPFKYWRGSMKYRFQIVCSNYHRGRLKFVYDPVKTPNGGAEYNTAYTTIVDISETTDFTITVGWGQDTTYREMIPLGLLAQSVFSDSSQLVYSSATTGYGNGTLAVYVVNELTVPNDTINNDIEINVFVSAGDDVEFAVPFYDILKKMRLTNSVVVIEPQGEEVVMDSHPLHAENIDVLASTSSLTDKTNLVHFGENIRSFRQLLKRYNLYELVALNADQGTDAEFYMQRVLEMLPTEGGYTLHAGDFTYPLFPHPYKYCYMTLLKYVTVAFGGWKGGVRWMFDVTTGQRGSGGDRFSTTSIGPYHGADHNSDVRTSLNTLWFDMQTALGNKLYLNLNADTQGHNGIVIQSSDINPITCAEVPYYSRYRFTPAKQRTDYSSVAFGMPEFVQHMHYWDGRGLGVMKLYCAAAEDFTCFLYLGPPVFYIENVIPDM